MGTWLFADAQTIASLGDNDTPRVLLFGSYGGHSNFGDILQLKGSIRFHAAHTGLKPVLVAYLAAVPGPGFTEKLRRWFGVEEVLFVSHAPHDASAHGLMPLTRARSIDYLHLYGGGFLNRFWGAPALRFTEGLLRQFQVSHYVVTGQQFDPAFTPALARHFAQFPPMIAGGRDEPSAQMIAELGLPGGFSFDDATEVLLGWAARRPAAASDARLLLHLNTSSYTADAPDTRELADKLAALAAKYPADHRPLLLQAFDDRRVAVKDTLPSVAALEDDFPFPHYEVLNLAQLALRLDPADTAPDPWLGHLRGDMAFASSYHTTYFLNLLGVPCHLHHTNAYYRQKVAGLGGQAGFEAFLADPRVTSYAPQLAARRDWQAALARLIQARPSRPAAPIAFAPRPAHLVTFWPKGQEASRLVRLADTLSRRVPGVKALGALLRRRP